MHFFVDLGMMWPEANVLNTFLLTLVFSVCSMWRSINRLRSIRFTSVLKLQLEPMDLNSKIKLTFLLLQLGTSNLRHL